MSRSPEIPSEPVRRKKRQARRGRDRDRQPAWLWIVLLFALASLTAAWASSCGKQQTAYSDIPESTVRRSRLELSTLRETAYFTDRMGWLESNPKQAESGLRYFYEKTGVQPHLYIRSAAGARTVGRAEMDGYAEALYGSLFSDGGHLLILLDEQPDREPPFMIGFAAGRDAASVLDEEALAILEAYWKAAFSDGEGLTSPQKAAAAGEALRRTADNIMGERNSTGWVIALVVLVGALLLFAGRDFLKAWNRLNKKEDRAGSGNA